MRNGSQQSEQYPGRSLQPGDSGQPAGKRRYACWREAVADFNKEVWEEDGEEGVLYYFSQAEEDSLGQAASREEEALRQRDHDGHEEARWQDEGGA